MSKQWLIEKWESKEGAPAYKLIESPLALTKREIYVAGYGVARKEILDDLKQLDEPKKVVVPKFVAEWIEYAKKKGDSLIVSFNPWDLYGAEYIEATRWIDNNQETFALAWVNGYEVEKEQLYYVKFDILHSQKYLVKNVKTSQFYLSNNENVIGNYEQVQFTEQEIKAIDERYWLFKEEVDGE
ncbi:DUF1642 domain-containing protein [Enterococcus faecalis]|uniref:DUF1642 domain-containing protein n=1 Tax=Enterococcus faecalis TaxID=1351 RepID=UPI000352E994|nr:DUF1642 domain-containing protein [Enterococcus faecalis]EPH69945.1 hypothetical protein D928_02079 [Enterococcus faecalis 20-SD-BW-06]EPI02038.1 hypothetical protein D919_01265 [Enterococcus faecalis 20-SD-BW-08]